MRNRRSDSQCAAILYAALELGCCYSKKDILSVSGLSTDELTRARRLLVAVEALQFEPTRISTKPAYALTGKNFCLPAPQQPVSPPLQHDRFQALLEVWQIEMPTCEVSVGRRVNLRFAQDDDALQRHE
jgi:hypothetical protein